jgi:hypothetical protein
MNESEAIRILLQPKKVFLLQIAPLAILKLNPTDDEHLRPHKAVVQRQAAGLANLLIGLPLVGRHPKFEAPMWTVMGLKILRNQQRFEYRIIAKGPFHTNVA